MKLLRVVRDKTDHKELQNYIVIPNNCWQLQRNALEKNNPDINYYLVKRWILDLLCVVS